MKLLIKPESIVTDDKNIDGLILPLDSYSVDYDTYFSLEDIKEIKKKSSKEIFIVMNRMIVNKEVESLKRILKEIDSLNITGIFFYDLSILALKEELHLKTDLVWNATHMTTNYKTCNYYFQKRVKYAYLSNEITLEEALEIKQKSKIVPMFTLIGYPTVAMSRRQLITNYQKMHQIDGIKALEIEEQITKEKYLIKESKYGTTFKLGKILNQTEALEKLKEVDFPYLILIEDGIEHTTFLKVLEIVKKNLEENTSLDEISNLIGNHNGFLQKETIYQVKKNG